MLSPEHLLASYLSCFSFVMLKSIVNTNMPRVKRQDAMGAHLSSAWANHGWADRARMVTTALMNMPYFILSDVLWKALGKNEWRREGSQNTEVVAWADNIFTCKYWQDFNTTCIVRANGKLLLISAPPTHAHTVEQLKKLGKVDVLLVTTFHDSCAYKWKDLYPDAKILCPAKARSDVESSVAVHACLEDKEGQALLKEFNIVEVKDASKFSCCHDNAFVIALQGEGVNANARAVAMPCGFGNLPFTPMTAILGFWGLRLMRQFSLMFCHSIPEAVKFWQGVSAVPNLELLVLNHGDPVVPR